jgi:hypothetical protein
MARLEAGWRTGLVLAFTATAWPVLATQYAAQPRASLEYIHDDNFRLIPEQQPTNQNRSLYGETYGAGINATASEESWQMELDVELEFERFNREEFDSDDQFVRFSGSKRTEKQVFQLSANIIRDSIRSSSELDNGLVVAGRSERYNLAPSWQYYFTERAYAGLSVTAETADYDDDFNQLVGYDYGQGQFNTGYMLNEKLTLTGYLLASEYRGDSSDITGFVQDRLFNQLTPVPLSYSSETTTQAWGLGVDYQWNEQLKLSLTGGRRTNKTEYVDVDDPLGACPGVANSVILPDGEPRFIFLQGDVCGSAPDSSSTTWSASMDWTGERQRLQASYEDADQPSSSGYLQRSKIFRGSWDYRLTEKQTLSVDGQWLRNNVEDQDPLVASRGNRDYAKLALRYRYRLFREWDLSIGYQYRVQDRDTQIDQAESHVGTLSINYRPEKTLWSR